MFEKETLPDVSGALQVAECIGTHPTRGQIIDFEQRLAQLPNAVFELPTFHHFAPGMYARELRIPAGMVLTGKTHKQEHLNFLMSGDITVWIDGDMRRVQGPMVFVSQPGTKRVGYAHTDVVWVTVHATQETDLDKIEAEVIAPPDMEMVASVETGALQ